MSAAATQAMERFRSKLCTHLLRIKQATYADEVRVQTIKDGFMVTVLWTEKPSQKKSHSVQFLQSTVLGEPGRGFAPKGKPCDYARKIIGEVLSQRGV